jgi:hypothetical protein
VTGQLALGWSEIGGMLLALRLITSLGVVILAARQRMWASMVVGLALLVIEPCAVIAALRSDGPWIHGLLRAYLAMAVLAVLGWRAGVRFRTRHGDSELRREATELPLLHPFLAFVDLLFVGLPVALFF